MKKKKLRWAVNFILFSLVFLAGWSTGAEAAHPEDANHKPHSGCLQCHTGIENIRDGNSKMMQEIQKTGTGIGDPNGCTVCHGGNLSGTTAKSAHSGVFYADPGSPWINQKTCGRCHKDQVRAQWQSLMMTEAGKIQGTAWSAGGLEGYKARWANYDVANPKDPHDRLGTPEYRAYRERLASLEPQAYPDSMEGVPAAPQPYIVKDHPEQASFTYIRQECERCHLAVKGRQKRGDYRGMGCSACHIPYGNEGFYEGKDPAIPKNEPGHLLIHRIQATREAKVSIHGVTYSGIPVETCTTCHDRGKRIGVSFQGLMESAYNSPWGKKGTGQPGLHTKHYLSMHGDIHQEKGMLCQDCHTSLDIHGDGFLSGTTLAPVEIECSDCHGTPQAYPWELPLGFGDEFGASLSKKPRGTIKTLLKQQEQGTVYPPEDGYLLSARGNPLGNVVRKGDSVIVHTAGGKDFSLAPLKLKRITNQLSLEGKVAMASVSIHVKKMECYSCHARWAPQCYGCHVKVDYSQNTTGYDWVAAGRARLNHLLAYSSHDPKGKDFEIPGRISEQRSYLRWENPALGVNGEGRITPIIPGCQVNYTVIGKDGKTIIYDKIFRTPPGTEGGGPEGQLSIDMSPVQPHTNGEPRPCESCHTSPKAAGYGIGGGDLMTRPDSNRIVDLMTAEGKILPKNVKTQISGVKGLVSDWSRVVTEDGRQLQTVGHHFKGSRPLNNEERALLDRRGICLSCHKEIPKASLPVSLLHHVASVTGQLPTTPQRHINLVHKVLLLSAWTEVGGTFIFGLAVLVVLILLWRKKRNKTIS